MTTHSHLLSYEELKQVEEAIEMKIVSFYLHEFDTELNFSNKVGYVVIKVIMYVCFIII